MKRRRRVPEVLWRVYGNRARSLAETIVDLLTPPPLSAVECQCKGLRCLGCSGADALSFLLRPGDPSDYKKLLNQCFVVVSENAPRFSGFYTDCRWSQRQIVTRTIEMIRGDSSMSPNVICNGYNMCTHSNSVVDLLTTSSWSLFLRRIGDEAMVHLLKFASIFLPLPHGNHHQLTGYPISDLCSKYSKDVSGYAYQPPLPIQAGHPHKRKRIDNEDKSNLDIIVSALQPSYSFGVCSPSGSVICHDCNHRSHIGELHWQHCRKHSQISFTKADMLNTCTACDNDENNCNGEVQQNSNKARTKAGKRFRPFSWQRRRKRRQINFAEENVLTTSITTGNDKEKQNCITSLSHQSKKVLPFQDSEKQLALDVHTNVRILQCLCISMLHAPLKIGSGTHISRKFMFYNSNHFFSLFPRNHLLNTLKPNDSGATSLIKDIFGVSDGDLTTQLMLCFNKCGFCLNGSACLYHKLLKLLKCLIRRTRGCQHLEMLEKHCSVPSMVPFSKGEVGSTLERNESPEKLLHKSDAGFVQECNFPQEKLVGRVSRLQQEHHQRTLRACDRQFELSGSYCLKYQVISFILAVCRSIVPSDLLGDPSNWRALQRNISKFIQLRKFEKFSLKQCMQGLKTSCFPLLSDKHSSCYLSNHMLGQGTSMLEGCNKFTDAKVVLKNKIFSCWIYWFFSRIVVPVLQANFYVTETEVGKLEIFFYRKPIWDSLTSRAITCLTEQSYSLLDDTSFCRILSKRSFGFSKVRFCPKDKGVRALANLKAPSKVAAPKHLHVQQSSLKFYYFKPVNYVLRDLSAVLKGIKMNHPENLGSSVFDYNDVHKKLTPFLIGLKNGSKTIPSVFVVICDVSKAFDSVDQDKLLNVMKDVMMSEDYLVNWYPKVVCTKKSLWVHTEQILLDQNISTAITKSTVSVPFHSLHSVIINQEKSRKIRREKLYHDLREHVKCNVLELGQNFYLQKVGIPQGSVLSSLLCSFYYAHMERNVIFPFLEKIQECHSLEPAKRDSAGIAFCDDDAAEKGVKDNISVSPNHVLLRFIDDFLFISTSKKQAASFFSMLHNGIREYNCSINEAKSCMNFDMGHISGLSSNRVYTGDDGISFLPWSGLLINCCTLEIQADYTRYLDIHLSSTLTVCWQDKPGHHLKAKLCHYMRPKCHPIFYDSNINSADVIRLNIYQSFLLCAMKFHCYVCNLSNICTFRAKFYFEIITSSLRYMHKLITKRMHSIKLGSFAHPVVKLKKEVEWLGLNAYIRVLKMKQSRHTELLSLLRSDLLTYDIVVSASLKYAVDDSHSSLFWKIKY